MNEKTTSLFITPASLPPRAVRAPQEKVLARALLRRDNPTRLQPADAKRTASHRERSRRVDNRDEKMIGNIMGFWIDVSSNLIADIGAAALLACVPAVWNKFRARLLRRSLVESFGPLAGSFSGEGFGIGIKNNTSVDVVIRSIMLLLRDRGSIILTYKGPSGEIGWGAANKGGEVAAVIEETDNSRGFQILPAHTGGEWIIHRNGMRMLAAQLATAPWFSKCRMLVEYPTLFGGRKIMEAEASDHTMELINRMAQQYLQWVGDQPRETARGPNRGPDMQRPASQQ
jgi:hypothetical protein